MTGDLFCAVTNAADQAAFSALAFGAAFFTLALAAAFLGAAFFKAALRGFGAALRAAGLDAGGLIGETFLAPVTAGV